jgi:RNA polymerase sigma-70 factor (ECF subfamily)
VGQVRAGNRGDPFFFVREFYGFVPGVFRAQEPYIRAIEGEASLLGAVLASQHVLPRVQKHRIVLAVAAARLNAYVVALEYQTLSVLGVRDRLLEQIVADHREAGLAQDEVDLLDFAVKLAVRGRCVSRQDVARLLAKGCDEKAILEAALVAAWANFLCSLSLRVGCEPDFEPLAMVSVPLVPDSEEAADNSGPYLPTLVRKPGPPAPGFCAGLFEAQGVRPDIVKAESDAIRLILLEDDALAAPEKQRIALAVSEANGNVYWTATLDHLLGGESAPPSDRRLLDLALNPAARSGPGDAIVVETSVTAALTDFLNTLQWGLGVAPEFDVGRAPRKTLHLSPTVPRPTVDGSAADPDAETVARVRGGDLDAFEGLITRHSRRVYRTLLGILGNAEEARDAMQDTFLKAFQHLGSFEGRSRFSTWLVSIATNTGAQILRERKNVQSLDHDDFDSDEDFRPRDVRAWADDPEELYSKAETSSLVERGILALPSKYRVVLMLRDLEQLSIEEAASALRLGIPALKARQLRGRLMLREALAPHFAQAAKGGGA